MPLVKRATRVVMLSGTPALNRPIELWAQLDGLRPGSFGTYYEFGTRYCAGFDGPFGARFPAPTHHSWGSRRRPKLIPPVLCRLG